MIFKTRLLQIYGPYVLIVLSLSVFSWLYINLEQRRYSDILIMRQAMEIQTRLSKIQTKLIILRYNNPRLIDDAEYIQQFKLIKFEFKLLNSLPYIGRFLTKEDIKKSQTAYEWIDQQNFKNFSTANPLDTHSWVINTLSDVNDLQGNAIIGNEALSTLQQHENSAFYYRVIGFCFALFLSISAIYIFVQNKNNQNNIDRDKIFFSLFSHMTKSRIASLKLFIEQIQRLKILNTEMANAALETSTELSSITQTLLNLTNDNENKEQTSLGRIIEIIKMKHPQLINVQVEEHCIDVKLPSSLWQLILSELITNSIAATAHLVQPVIALRAKIKKSLFNRPIFQIEIIDNGIGIPNHLIKKVTKPFFSTRSGSHTGLGLTSCSEFIKRMGGNITIVSEQNFGTTIRLEVPIKIP